MGTIEFENFASCIFLWLYLGLEKSFPKYVWVCVFTWVLGVSDCCEVESLASIGCPPLIGKQRPCLSCFLINLIPANSRLLQAALSLTTFGSHVECWGMACGAHLVSGPHRALPGWWWQVGINGHAGPIAKKLNGNGQCQGVRNFTLSKERTGIWCWFLWDLRQVQIAQFYF